LILVILWLNWFIQDCSRFCCLLLIILFIHILDFLQSVLLEREFLWLLFWWFFLYFAWKLFLKWEWFLIIRFSLLFTWEKFNGIIVSLRTIRSELFDLLFIKFEGILLLISLHCIQLLDNGQLFDTRLMLIKLLRLLFVTETVLLWDLPSGWSTYSFVFLCLGFTLHLVVVLGSGSLDWY